MQTVTIYKGLPGSGKTTHAKKIVQESEGKIKRINKDDLRAMLDDGKYSSGREDFVLAARNCLLIEALIEGYSVIIDDTNLHEKHESAIRKLVSDTKPDAQVLIEDSFLKVPVRECIERDAKRDKPVGSKVIHRMAMQAGIGQVEPYYIEGLPKCIICDLDGTLALLGNRNPFDASTCETDMVNPQVAWFVKDVRLYHGYPVFYFSGRSEKDRAATENWLWKNDLNFHEALVMRPDGNYEKDAIIKERMFEEHIRGKFNVHLVLDDREQVVDKWRELGLTCWAVNEGRF